ncbi:MAG: hypothetical protein ACI8WB_006257 [Phenylobacterium sp.]|jgi:hypothetical protein
MKLKLKLNKKNLKNLSKDNALLPIEATPQIAGGGRERPTSTPTTFAVKNAGI